MPRFSRENDYNAIIASMAMKYGVEPELIKAVIGRESQFSPRAYRAEPAINDASRGLMQILFATAKGQGYGGTADGLFDPAANIEYGTEYLKSCLSRVGGDITAAVSMYNGGYRPDIGFGKQATRQVTVCIARDQTTGRCISSKIVKPGEFANQDHVNAVMQNYVYFKSLTTPPAPPPPVISSGGGKAPGKPGSVAKPTGKIVASGGGLGILIALLAFFGFRKRKG